MLIVWTSAGDETALRSATTVNIGGSGLCSQELLCRVLLLGCRLLLMLTVEYLRSLLILLKVLLWLLLGVMMMLLFIGRWEEGVSL